MSASAGSDDAQPSNENITNNQEAGVDEGGIVKNIGGSLVVLRQGRLYVVDVAGDAPVLTDSMRAARTESLNSGAWYDEMLARATSSTSSATATRSAMPARSVRSAPFVGDVLLAVTDTYDAKKNLHSSLQPLGTDRALIATEPRTASGLTLRTVSLEDLGKPLGEEWRRRADGGPDSLTRHHSAGARDASSSSSGVRFFTKRSRSVSNPT